MKKIKEEPLGVIALLGTLLIAVASYAYMQDIERLSEDVKEIKKERETYVTRRELKLILLNISNNQKNLEDLIKANLGAIKENRLEIKNLEK